MDSAPIDKLRDALDAHLASSQTVLLVAPTGAGKSTRVPRWRSEAGEKTKPGAQDQDRQRDRNLKRAPRGRGAKRSDCSFRVKKRSREVFHGGFSDHLISP